MKSFKILNKEDILVKLQMNEKELGYCDSRGDFFSQHNEYGCSIFRFIDTQYCWKTFLTIIEVVDYFPRGKAIESRTVVRHTMSFWMYPFVEESTISGGNVPQVDLVFKSILKINSSADQPRTCVWTRQWLQSAGAD